MKPVYLEFCGVNSFSEKACIDFTKLFTSGVFGIFGDTGSGKSTILDCIQLALYGSIDRTSSQVDCINDRSDGYYVIYDFELQYCGERKKYRVRRDRTRKSSNNAKAFLYEYNEDGKLLALAEGTGDVNAKLLEIIGLDVKDFKMCIALPQGEFAGLVKSKPAERLALVSRLFDLGKYGERLKFYLKEKCDQAEEEQLIVKAKMDSIEDCSDEKRAALIEDLNAKTQELSIHEKRYTDAEKRLQEIERLLEEKLAYEVCVKKLEEAEKHRLEYEKKRELLKRYPTLSDLNNKRIELAKVTTERSRLEQDFKMLLEKVELTEKGKAAAQKLIEEARYDEQIGQQNKILGMFEAADEDFLNRDKLQKSYEACRAEYKELQSKLKNEPYDEWIEQTRIQLESLGEDETISDYLKHHFKEGILEEGYAAVREDLKLLAEKYPQTKVDVERLIEKYTLRNGARGFDLQAGQAEFKKLEEERKALKKRLDELEKAKKIYDETLGKLQNVEERGKLIGESLKLAKEKVAGLEKYGSKELVKETLETLSLRKAKAESRLKEMLEQELTTKAKAEKCQGLIEKYLLDEKQLSTVLSEGLSLNGYSTTAEVSALLLELGDAEKASVACSEFFENYRIYQTKIAETNQEKFDGVSVEKKFLYAEEKRQAENLKRQVGGEIGGITAKIESLDERKKRFGELNKEYEQKNKTFLLWSKLKAAVTGNRSNKTLMEYVATEYLRDVCNAASKTLLSLTGGRYFLLYEDGDFYVGDNFHGGIRRLVKTLSGGETFLVSLSLALSLSAEICKKSLRPIEFFFLDEGFGTLDEKLVDTVMDVLGKLSKSFTIGLISHVEELKHRIENKILVSGATETKGSELRLECY